MRDYHVIKDSVSTGTVQTVCGEILDRATVNYPANATEPTREMPTGPGFGSQRKTSAIVPRNAA